MTVATYDGYDIRGEVIGTEGAIQIGSMRQQDIRIFSNNKSGHDLVADFPTRFANAYLLEIVHFIDSLRKVDEPSSTARVGKKALEIAYAGTKSISNEKTV